MKRARSHEQGGCSSQLLWLLVPAMGTEVVGEEAKNPPWQKEGHYPLAKGSITPWQKEAQNIAHLFHRKEN